jgi:hypothetical protein
MRLPGCAAARAGNCREQGDHVSDGCGGRERDHDRDEKKATTEEQIERHRAPNLGHRTARSRSLDGWPS